MKTLIFFCLSMLFLAGCGSSGGSSSTTSTATCTYQNGYYLYNGVQVASCPAGTAVTSSACTYSNNLYYYNGVGYATCPVASTGYGTTGVHNCANLTLMDSYGQIGVCTVNYNYCAGYTMYSTQGGGQIYCQ